MTSAMPRRICDRITPELPRAPLRAPDDRAEAVLKTSVDFASVLASASAERMVNSMLTPGVGVGDGEHVEPVDLVDVGDQVTDGGMSPVT